MKKTILLLNIFLLSFTGYSQIKSIDLVAKSNLTYILEKSSITYTSLRPGIETGLLFKFSFKEKMDFMVGGSFQLVQWKQNSNKENFIFNRKIFHFKLPIQVSYHLADKWLINGGIWGAYVIGADYTEQHVPFSTGIDKKQFRQYPFGTNLGMDYQINSKITCTWDCAVGLNRTYDSFPYGSNNLTIFSFGIKTQIK